MLCRATRLTLTLSCAVGCATSSPLPNERVQSTSAAIRDAEEVGAAHSAEAALHLKLAKDQFEYAQHLPNPNDRARVDRLLRRAQADAELSLALARGEDDEARASAALEKLKKLNQSASQ
jgi:hypothetical protein